MGAKVMAEMVYIDPTFLKRKSRDHAIPPECAEYFQGALARSLEGRVYAQGWYPGSQLDDQTDEVLKAKSETSDLVY